MTFLRKNIMTIVSLTFLFVLVMMGDSYAATVFGTARTKMVDLFTNAKTIVFVIGGFGLIGLAFQALFGKIKWPWFATLAFGLAVVAAAGAVVDYAANKGVIGKDFEDSYTTTLDSVN